MIYNFISKANVCKYVIALGAVVALGFWPAASEAGVITSKVYTGGDGFQFDIARGYTPLNTNQTAVNYIHVNAHASGLRASANVATQAQIYSDGKLVYSGPTTQLLYGPGINPQTKGVYVYQQANRVVVNRKNNLVKIKFVYRFTGAVGGTGSSETAGGTGGYSKSLTTSFSIP